jgi:hypothetical protein
MTGYTKLAASILQSSIWSEDDRTRIVWITLLAMANQHGEVLASIPGVARMAGVPIADAEMALRRFLSPDPYSRTPDKEGRRLEAIEGGWVLVNHAKYRAAFSREDQKAKTAERVARHRAKGKPVTPEALHVTGGNGKVTHGNASVTQTMHIAEAEAEAVSPLAPLSGGKEPKAPRPRFVEPTREELDLAAAKIGLASAEVDKFVAYYGSNGWRVGRNPMRSWQHALTRWKLTSDEHRRTGSAGHGRPTVAELRNATLDERDVAAVRANAAASAERQRLRLEADPDYIPI